MPFKHTCIGSQEYANEADEMTYHTAHHALSPAVIDSDSKQSLQEEEERPRVAQAQDYLCF